MRNVLVIFQKEMRSYFVSPIAYLMLALFALVSAFFFGIYVRGFIEYGMEMQMSGQSAPLNLNEQVIRPLLSNASVLGLFFIPMIAMRLFAEEKRNGTIELLVTSPIHDVEIVVGKWLAAMGLYVCMLIFPALNFVFLFKYGNPDWKPLVIGFLGLLLQVGAMLAIGMFISTLTKNQIIAAAVTFSLFVVLWVISAVSEFNTASWAQAVSYTSLVSHMESFQRGMIDSKDAIFYVSVIFLGLFLTLRSMESLRWRS
jgi:ABC-2 type transport system permease protein